MSIKREQALKAYTMLKDYRALVTQATATATKLFTHQEATANQVMHAQLRLAKMYKDYREYYKTLSGHFRMNLPWSKDWVDLKLH